jgi:mono/diheme cytochrome c family protein
MTHGSSGKRRSFAPILAAVALCGAAAGAGWHWHQANAFVPGDASDLDQVAHGSRVYDRICANCHGAKLDGQLGWRKPLKDGTRLAPAHSAEGETWRHSDEMLFEVVKFGGERLSPDGGSSRMPGFEAKLTDQEIWSVIAFIKSTWPSDLLEAQQSALAE